MTTTTATVLLVCSQCSSGYYATSDTYDLFGCMTCDHTVTSADLELDEGETLVMVPKPEAGAILLGIQEVTA